MSDSLTCELNCKVEVLDIFGRTGASGACQTKCFLDGSINCESCLLVAYKGFIDGGMYLDFAHFSHYSYLLAIAGILGAHVMEVAYS